MEKTLKRFPVTRKGFITWLQDHHPDVHVGYARDCSDCPFGMYLRSCIPNLYELDVSDESTSFTGETAEGEEDYIQLINPKWLVKFIQGVDGLCAKPSELTEPWPVTAKQALSILDV